MKDKIKVDELVIDGTTYVPKGTVSEKAKKLEGMPFVCIRTYSAGVHCGYLDFHKGKEVHLVDSIRIWYWKGAASLSQLAMEGVKNPDECKFGMLISNLVLTEAIEIIDMTEVARLSIQNVPSWKE